MGFVFHDNLRFILTRNRLKLHQEFRLVIRIFLSHGKANIGTGCSGWYFQSSFLEVIKNHVDVALKDRLNGEHGGAAGLKAGHLVILHIFQS